MEASNNRIAECGRRLMLSRMRILNENGFYGLLLMHMKFMLDEECSTAATDGEIIYFAPNFLSSLTDCELDFVMMHEVLHAALRHTSRGGNYDPEVFNIACDIVVNANILLSNEMDFDSISIGGQEMMHLAPNGREGYEYTAEAVYEMFPTERRTGVKLSHKKSGGTRDARFDDHSRWGTAADGGILRDQWTKRLQEASVAMQNRGGEGIGVIPLGVERLLKELRTPQTDWKEILAAFIQEEITDYSLMPPDRRFDDSPFFLPDFNEKADTAQDILFMIDTSGSMGDDEVAAVYSEVKGAVDQFDGALCGWLGFFDAEVIAPRPFNDEASLRMIKPCGGGGTDFYVIFQYVKEHMKEHLPAMIIVLTDGYAPFPEEWQAMGIPVLWLIINSEATPPWGKTARIKM